MEIKPSSHLPDPDDIVIGEDKILPMGCHRTAQLCGNPEDKSPERGSGLTLLSAPKDASLMIMSMIWEKSNSDPAFRGRCGCI